MVERPILTTGMAKDTEKLVRQLSLISFLMAERRPVTALEIKQEVEGYAGMNDDAFARRFYADRSELESLGIELKVEKPAEGYYEAENYTLPPENFYLPAIEFSDSELGALRMALSLLDGEFAYAEPLRLALQQLSWGKPSPLAAPEERSVALAVTAGSGASSTSSAAWMTPAPRKWRSTSHATRSETQTLAVPAGSPSCQSVRVAYTRGSKSLGEAKSWSDFEA